MRTLHRWLMTVFAVLFVYWAGSGLTLAIWDLTDSTQAWAETGGPGARPGIDDHAVPLVAESIGSNMALTVKAAHTLLPDAPLTSIEVRMTSSGPRSIVTTGGEDPRSLTFDLQTQALLSNTAANARQVAAPLLNNRSNMHLRIKDWHRGNIVGDWGVAVALLTGIALLTMLVTGVVLYFSVWNLRRRSGRSSFFWS